MAKLSKGIKKLQQIAKYDEMRAYLRFGTFLFFDAEDNSCITVEDMDRIIKKAQDIRWQIRKKSVALKKKRA